MSDTKRRSARNLYLTWLNSAFSFCGLCGTQLVWRERLPDDATFHRVPGYKAVVTTPAGLQELFTGTIDHIQRLADGGSNDLENLAGLCAPCHQEKDNIKPTPRYCWICDGELDRFEIGCSHPTCNYDDRRLKVSIFDILNASLRR